MKFKEDPILDELVNSLNEHPFNTSIQLFFGRMNPQSPIGCVPDFSTTAITRTQLLKSYDTLLEQSIDQIQSDLDLLAGSSITKYGVYYHSHNFQRFGIESIRYARLAS